MEANNKSAIKLQKQRRRKFPSTAMNTRGITDKTQRITEVIIGGQLKKKLENANPQEN